MEVYQAIINVQTELAALGIGKNQKNQQQGFKFRGIDDVLNVLSPILAKHRLSILPRCTERSCIERQTQRGGVLFYVTVKVDYDFVASDGSKHTVSMYGEAMDSGDKATNKAMSAAYKYAAFQAFCIPTEETSHDADATTPEPLSCSLDPAKSSGVRKDVLEVYAGMPEELKGTLQDLATKIKNQFSENDLTGMRKSFDSLDDNEHKIAIWGLLDSKIRAAMKQAKTKELH